MAHKITFELLQCYRRAPDKQEWAPVHLQGIAFSARGTIILAGCYISSRAVFWTDNLICWDGHYLFLWKLVVFYSLSINAVKILYAQLYSSKLKNGSALILCVILC